jgi:crossover junction endodeoxyribonuclease RuvC
VDPGSIHTGYGVVELTGSTVALVACGRISPKPALAFPERLRIIFEGLADLIRIHRPQASALEDVFTNRNPRAAFRLAQARGAAIVALASASIPVFEYPPMLVKSSVCGSGRAEKTQVAFMVSRLLAMKDPVPADASDALACALCHAGQAGVTGMTPGASVKAAAKARSSSWRKLTPEDLAAMGYRVEGGR